MAFPDLAYEWGEKLGRGEFKKLENMNLVSSLEERYYQEVEILIEMNFEINYVKYIDMEMRDFEIDGVIVKIGFGKLEF